jgi:heat-inducible transcriptional repressor
MCASEGFLLSPNRHAGQKMDRSHDVLMTLIRSHIGTAEPVGSKYLLDRSGLDVSPATVRNLMARLEKEGYLKQPHTSAGRVPTDKAYRYYVNSLLGHGSEKPNETFRSALTGFTGGLDDMLRKTSKVLSDLSRCAGVVLPPRRVRRLFKRITFTRMNRGSVLAVLVSLSGVTTQKLVQTGEEFTQKALDRMSDYLNNRFAGMSLGEMRWRMEKDLARDLENFESWMTAALRLSTGLLEDPEGPEVYLEGGSRILDMPEFMTDFEGMRALFRAFEEKRSLAALLDETIKASDFTVFIGSETGVDELRGMSMVVSTYGRGGGALGAVGVIGPSRMDYKNIIPLVRSAGVMVSENFSTAENIPNENIQDENIPGEDVQVGDIQEETV